MIINTSLMPEFEMACDILYLRPEEVIETFMANVSLPYFCSTDQYLAEKIDRPNSPLHDSIFNKNKKGSPPNPIKILATNFMVSYCTLCSERFLPAQKVHKKYFKKYKALLPQLKKENNPELRCFRLMGFYLEWHKELIANMSENDAVIDVKSRKEKLKL